MDSIKHNTIIFVHIVEKGDLEKKSILLCNSIRKYCGIYKNSKIYAITPRLNKEVSINTKKIYKELNVDYIYKDINHKWYDQPYLNSIYGTAYIESLYLNENVSLVYVDSDTFFINQPDELDLIKNQRGIAVSPIDGIKSEIACYDINNISDYWRNIYKLVGVYDNHIWYTKTIYDKIRIIAYFNNGIMAVKPYLKIFNDTLNKIEEAYNNYYFSNLNPGSLERFYLDQAFISAVVLKHNRNTVLTLSDNYNYSLPLFKNISNKKFKTLIHIHYHSMFYFKNNLKIFKNNKPIYAFLKDYVPFYLDKKKKIIVFINSHLPQKIKNKIRETYLIKIAYKLFKKLGLEIG